MDAHLALRGAKLILKELQGWHLFDSQNENIGADGRARNVRNGNQTGLRSKKEKKFFSPSVRINIPATRGLCIHIRTCIHKKPLADRRLSIRQPGRPIAVHAC